MPELRKQQSSAPKQPSRSLSLAELKHEALHRRSGILRRMLGWITGLVRRRGPRIKTGPETVNVLWGNNLTYFVGSDGHGLGLFGPPLHAAHIAHHELKGNIGRDLTCHIAPDGKPTAQLFTLVRHKDAKPLPQRVLGAVLGALKWLFYIKPRVQVMERYIWGEVFGFFLMGCLAFTFFMIITTIFSLGEKIFSKHIPPFTIAKVMLLSAPQFLVLAIPVAVLFSTLMAMGRLNRDNEIIAMTTNGVSLYRIFVPFIAVAIGAGILTWSVYENVVPPYNKDTQDTLKTFWQAQVVDFIKPGIIIKAPNRKYFYIDRVDKIESRMYGIRLYDYMAEDRGFRHFPRMFLAEEGHIEDQYLALSNVTFYEIDKDTGRSLVEARMPEVRIDIATQLSDYEVRDAPELLSSRKLRTRIVRERDRLSALKMGDSGLASELNKDLVGYYFKYSVPIACLAFVLVGVPVSLRGPRDERNMGIILSFMLVMLYYILYFTCREVGSRGLYFPHGLHLFGLTLTKANVNLFPPALAGWLAPALFILASFVLIARARR